MLDDQNVIAQRDKSDALGLAAATPDQLRHNFGVAPQQVSREIRNVVFAGMGGSALQAEFVKTWPNLQVPFVIVKDYDAPAFVDEHTLFIAASYSGNTEETLSALAQVRAKNPMIVVMSGGGKLQELAVGAGDLFVQIPKAVQPRMAVFYAYRAFVEVLVAYGLAPETVIQELETTADHLEGEVKQWEKAVPLKDNPAKQLALQLVGKTTVIYAGTKMAPAAYKWKIGINESAKNTAWWDVLPEFNHNEFIGWSSHPVEKPFAVVDLLSSFEHERVQKRFAITDRLLSGLRPKAIAVEAKGSSAVEQMLYLVLFGDFVSLYLGILNGVDPSPVELVERFKKELG